MLDTFHTSHFKFPDRKQLINIPASFQHSKVSKKIKQPSTHGLKELVSFKNISAVLLKKIA